MADEPTTGPMQIQRTGNNMRRYEWSNASTSTPATKNKSTTKKNKQSKEIPPNMKPATNMQEGIIDRKANGYQLLAPQ
jgi:hypothetical protein